MVVFTSVLRHRSPVLRCKRLTKWWYLQVRADDEHHPAAVKGLQNGGIYKINGRYRTYDEL